MWAAIFNTILGLWAMISPGVLNYQDEAATKSYILGPIVVTFAITAIWEVNRSLRYVNIPLGLMIATSPFLISYEGAALYNDVVTGLMIASLSMIRGEVKGKYGGGWRSLVEKNPMHMQQEPTEH